MNFLKRYRLLIAAALVIIAGVAFAYSGLGSKFHTQSAAGTQSDSHVGSSQYPAPKAANHTPASASVAATENPDAIPALEDVNAKCPWAESDSSTRPSLQDAGGGAKKFSDMPANPSTNTLKCAIARAKAAGYYVAAGNSIKCDEPVVQLLDEGTHKLWSFRPFCMTVSQSGDETCKVPLIPTDAGGNFIWQGMTDLSWDQDVLGDKLRLRGSFAGC